LPSCRLFRPRPLRTPPAAAADATPGLHSHQGTTACSVVTGAQQRAGQRSGSQHQGVGKDTSGVLAHTRAGARCRALRGFCCPCIRRRRCCSRRRDPEAKVKDGNWGHQARTGAQEVMTAIVLIMRQSWGDQNVADA
jgi:hypothetical protein